MTNPDQNSPRKYNWDDLDVGNMCADNSELFFTGQRHYKHELLTTYCKSKENINLSGITPLEVMQANLQNEIDLAVTALKMPLKNVLCDANTFREKSEKSTKRGAAATPKAYCFKDIYQQKKQQLVIKQREEDRRMREFRSRPMPNFQACHKQLAKRPIVHHVTCPKTPNTLKISRALEQKRKLATLAQKAAEAELLKAKPKRKVRSTNYLKEQPFMPKKSQTVLEIKPFIFSTEKRAQARKQLKEQMKTQVAAAEVKMKNLPSDAQAKNQMKPLRKSISLDSVYADQLKVKQKAEFKTPTVKQPTDVHSNEYSIIRKSMSLQSVYHENPFLGLLDIDFKLFHL